MLNPVHRKFVGGCILGAPPLVAVVGLVAALHGGGHGRLQHDRAAREGKGVMTVSALPPDGPGRGAAPVEKAGAPRAGTTDQAKAQRHELLHLLIFHSVGPHPIGYFK